MKGIHLTDHYQLLGLPTTATAADIKARYRALSKQHHPDKGGSPAEMAKINQAYAILSDPFKRKIHDAERRRTAQTPSAPPRTTTTNASTRRPAPRSRSRFATGHSNKKRASWWPKIALGFASLIIIMGILLHLPIAEAVNTTEPDTQTGAQTLNVTYPPDPSASTHLVTNPTTNTAPSAPTETQADAPAPSAQEQADTTASRQKLRELCSLASRNRLYNTEYVQNLCKPSRNQD